MSSSSSEEYKRPKRKGIKKQFYKLKKDLIYNMKKTLQTKKHYANNDDDDYYYPSALPSRQSVPEYTETYTPSSIPEPIQEKQPTQSTPKYCFL